MKKIDWNTFKFHLIMCSFYGLAIAFIVVAIVYGVAEAYLRFSAMLKYVKG